MRFLGALPDDVACPASASAPPSAAASAESSPPSSPSYAQQTIITTQQGEVREQGDEGKGSQLTDQMVALLAAATSRGRALGFPFGLHLHLAALVFVFA